MMNAGLTLVIDGAGSSVFVGILDAAGAWLAQSKDADAPLEALFPATEQVLTDSGKTLSDVSGFIYAEGPGSVLGLRLCAMAIETWIRLYPQAAHLRAYNSLQLTAWSILAAEPDLTNALLVADWKKGAWNAVSIKEGAVGEAFVMDDAGLATCEGPLYHLPQRKGWQKPPVGAIRVDYNPSILNQIWQSPELLKSSGSVELYSAGANTFQKWAPDRHRASRS